MRKITAKIAGALSALALTLCMAPAAFAAEPAAAAAGAAAGPIADAAQAQTTNVSLVNASTINVGATYNTSFYDGMESRAYKFTLTNASKLNLNADFNIETLYVSLYDAAGDRIWGTYSFSWKSTLGAGSVREQIYLTKGTYYITFENNYYDYENRFGAFNFNLSATKSSPTFEEPQGGDNNTMATADAIKTDTTYRGQLAINDARDIYRFSLGNASKVV